MAADFDGTLSITIYNRQEYLMRSRRIYKTDYLLRSVIISLRKWLQCTGRHQRPKSRAWDAVVDVSALIASSEDEQRPSDRLTG